MQVEWKALQQILAASLANAFFGGAKRVQLLRDMCSRVLVACCISVIAACLKLNCSAC